VSTCHYLFLFIHENTRTVHACLSKLKWFSRFFVDLFFKLQWFSRFFVVPILLFFLMQGERITLLLQAISSNFFLKKIGEGASFRYIFKNILENHPSSRKHNWFLLRNWWCGITQLGERFKNPNPANLNLHFHPLSTHFPHLIRTYLPTCHH
jgi:hypothetical protein